MYFPDVISRAETGAAGSSPRSEGVATDRGDGVCGGEVVALPIPSPGAGVCGGEVVALPIPSPGAGVCGGEVVALPIPDVASIRVAVKRM